MNFDCDFIQLDDTHQAPAIWLEQASPPPPAHSIWIRYKNAVFVMTAVASLAFVGVSGLHFYATRKVKTAIAPALVKLGTLMPADNYTPKGAGMSAAAAARGGYQLTFDDGPHPKHTPALLGWLRANHIQATFFLVGENAARYPELVKRIAAEGHRIGNHTWSHANLTKLNDEKAHAEIQRTHDLIVKLTGHAPTLFRPPYGSLKTAQREWVTKQLQYETVLWDVDTEDWKLTSPATIAQRIERTLKPGGIVLAHDIHPRILQALPLVLPRLRARGLKPARLPVPSSSEPSLPSLAAR